ICIGTFAVTVSLVATSGAMLVVLPLAVPVIWFLFVGSHLLADVERSRLAALAGLDLVDPVPPLTSTGNHPSLFFRRLLERARSVPRWKEIAYLLLLFPVGLV